MGLFGKNDVGVFLKGAHMFILTMGRRKTNIVMQSSLNAQGYINQILQPEAVPFLQRHGPAILMHDIERPHIARLDRQFLNRNNVNVPPDMNPIEHIWDYLGRKVRARGNVHNLRDLENALLQEWNNIPNVVIRTLRNVNARSPCCLHQKSKWPHSIPTTVNIEFPICAE